MNNRLTIPELVSLLAEYTGKSREDAELFLKEFISIVANNLYADKLVKVKGLGTFKVIQVEKRESVHVNTGERFLIPEHYKFSFLPDKDLKELVNKPFSFFETTEISSATDFSDMEETEEEVDSDEETVEEVMPDEIKPDEVKPDNDMSIEEPAQPEPTQIIILPSEPEPESEPEVEVEPVKEELQDPLPFDDDFIQEKNSSSSLKLMIVSVFVLALIIIGGVYAYLALPGLKTVSHPVEIAETEVEESPVDSSDFVEESVSVTVDTVVAEKPAIEPEVTKPEVVVPDVKSNGILAKVKIEQGDRLTLISLEYYGSKIFWVYLYQYNKNIISNPNNVPIGTVIEVPAPETYGIDVHNKASVAKAAALQAEILAEK